MTETGLKEKKSDETIYTDLVESFMKESKLSDVDPMEKKKFMQLCVINKLNPFKNQVYAVPRNVKQKDGTRKKTITVTVAYTTYLERAEECGLLAWWTIMIKKENKKVTWGKITIHRKDWKYPFEYSADVEDFAVSDNILRNTKTESMMRKQLIRVGFSLCFPENCKSLEIETEIPVENTINSENTTITKAEVIDLPAQENTTPEPICVEPITDDQKEMIDRLCVALVDFQEIPKEPENYDEAEILIRSMQFSVGKLYIKDDRLPKLTLEDIQAIFVWDDTDIVNVKKAAIEKWKTYSTKK